MLNIVKIGGNIIDNPEKLHQFLTEFAALPSPKILIHGGGKEATRLSATLGIETQMIEGRRVTDRQTLDVVTMVYAGLINKRIVARLQSCGCNAIGLSGADADVIPATRRSPIPVDFGYVGDIDPESINTSFIETLLQAGIVPVFCAICHDSHGSMLNCNADSVASAVALAMSRVEDVRLSYCFEMPGVLADINDPDSLIPFVTPADYERLISEGIIVGGMIPKIGNAVRSVQNGVREVRICHASALRSGRGTIIHNPIASPLPATYIGQPLPPHIQLLMRLIATPSPSREEEATARIWLDWLHDNGAPEAELFYNNVYAVAPGFDPSRPTLMLNSHHDTVRPASGWVSDPYTPEIINGELRGLGSSDAGGSAVALAMTYLQYRDRSHSLPYNLILAITAAEEVMDEKGMRAFIPHLESLGMRPDMAIVGEPTSLQPSIGERGLIVLDGITEGVAGHAARGEGENALYKALEDIQTLTSLTPPRVSETMGPVSINVTMIDAGTQHNVIPDRCRYVVDVRTTDAWPNAEMAGWLQSNVRHSLLTPRSTRVWPSLLPSSHPLYKAICQLGLKPFISPTTSDIALLHGIPSLKIGPGDSARSHTPEEALPLDQLEQALTLYPAILDTLLDVLILNS